MFVVNVYCKIEHFIDPTYRPWVSEDGKCLEVNEEQEERNAHQRSLKWGKDFDQCIMHIMYGAETETNFNLSYTYCMSQNKLFLDHFEFPIVIAIHISGNTPRALPVKV